MSRREFLITEVICCTGHPGREKVRDVREAGGREIPEGHHLLMLHTKQPRRLARVRPVELMRS
jgi:hypothetical protein